MKVATTIIQNAGEWICLECGVNITEQKDAVKQLVAKFGPGPVSVMCIANRGVPVRKKIALKGDAVKAWDEAKKAGEKHRKEIAKSQEAAAKEYEEAKKKILEAKAARRGKMTGKAKG